MILENATFIDGLTKDSMYPSALTALALGNCDPLTITLIGHGGNGGSGNSL